MKIVLIESNILWGDVSANLAQNDAVISGLLSSGAIGRNDLVLMPECFSTGYAMSPELLGPENDNVSLEWMKRKAAEYKVAMYSSLPVVADGKCYNRGYFILPSGEIAATYDKRHLFMGDEAGFYTPGCSRTVVDYCGWRLCLNICYDLRFPVWSRNTKGADGKYYDIMLNVSNWPTSRLDVSRLLTKARALENQCYMFFCNRVGSDPLTVYGGGSEAVDPKGRPMGQSVVHEGINCIIAEPDRLWIDSFREYFPVLEDADRFTVENR